MEDPGQKDIQTLQRVIWPLMGQLEMMAEYANYVAENENKEKKAVQVLLLFATIFEDMFIPKLEEFKRSVDSLESIFWQIKKEPQPSPGKD